MAKKNLILSQKILELYFFRVVGIPSRRTLRLPPSPSITELDQVGVVTFTSKICYNRKLEEIFFLVGPIYHRPQSCACKILSGFNLVRFLSR